MQRNRLSLTKEHHSGIRDFLVLRRQVTVVIRFSAQALIYLWYLKGGVLVRNWVFIRVKALISFVEKQQIVQNTVLIFI